MAKRIVVIDNYDSFVYNLVQYIGELGAEPEVYRNDAIDVTGLASRRPDGLLISPGPGRPEDAGVSLDAINSLAGEVPILGVCLGYQCIGQHYGGTVGHAPALMHGKTSDVSHDGQGVFAGLDDPLVATRYHSLIVEADTITAPLEATAWASDGTVMGLRHARLPVEGVQFHPESVLTASGHRMMANWLEICGRRPATAQAL